MYLYLAKNIFVPLNFRWVWGFPVRYLKTQRPQIKFNDPFYCNLNELTLASLMFLANGSFLSFFQTVDYFFPFSNHQIGQSISSEHRRMGCCWDRDCTGLNEALRNFRVRLRVWCMDYVICAAWVHWGIIINTLRIQDLNRRSCSISDHQGVSGHMRLSLIGWVWAFYWRAFEVRAQTERGRVKPC